jgi:hypothetical protein
MSGKQWSGDGDGMLMLLLNKDRHINPITSLQ